MKSLTQEDSELVKADKNFEFRAILPQAEGWNRNLLWFKHEKFYQISLKKMDY